MNKIYKVVWSKAKHCYVVTSELAKRNGKGCGARSLRMAAVTMGVAASLLCAGGALLFFSPSVAEASTIEVTSTDYTGLTKYTYNFDDFYAPSSTDVTSLNIKAGDHTVGFAGGYKQGADVKGKSLTVSGGTVKGYLAGGWAMGSSGKAENNTLSITGGTIDSNSGSYEYAGGRALNGDTINNTVNVNDAVVFSSSATIYGGFAFYGDAKDNNSVNISDGTFQGNATLVGGWASNNNATDNSVSISGGTFEKSLTVYGSRAYKVNVTGNSVTVSGGTFQGNTDIYGGFAQSAGGTGDGEANTVTVSGGTFNGNTSVYGGYAGSGAATGNKVTIGNATVSGSVYGGYAEGFGTATYNSVTIEGGTVTVNSYGGYGYGGNADNNTVTMTAGEVNNSVYGGVSGMNSASSNTVKVSGGKVSDSVIGGKIEDIVASSDRNVKGNIVEISGDAEVESGVYGGQVTAVTANVEDNQVIIKENSKVDGGVSGGESRKGNAIHNIVTIEGGTLTYPHNFGGNIIGGEVSSSETGMSKNNEVNISGGTIGESNYHLEVMGGFAQGGETTDNKVTISGGTITGTVDGAYNTGDVANNSVTITGGTLLGEYVETGSIYISHVAGGRGTGKASDNTVTFTDGTFSGIIIGGEGGRGATGNTVTIGGGDLTVTRDGARPVYGGRVDNSGYDATGNAVNLTGSTTGLETRNLIGGYVINNGSGDVVTGNELHVGGTKDGSVTGAWTGSSNNTVNKVANFETIAFHSVNWSTSVAALEATTVDNVGTLDITKMSILNESSGSMNLLKAGNVISGITLKYNDGAAVSLVGNPVEIGGGSAFTDKALTDYLKVTGVGGGATVSLAEDNKAIVYSTSGGQSTVSSATITGAVAWDAANAYYSNTGYTFNDDATVNLEGLTFSGTVTEDPLNTSMTLISGKVAGTLTQPTDASVTVSLDKTNTTLAGKATGTAAIEGGSLKYTLNAVALDTVTVKSVGNTADAVPASWTLAAGATVETDSMKEPSGIAAGTTQEIIKNESGGSFFDGITINGKYKWKEGGESIAEKTHESGVVISEGTTTGGGVKVNEAKDALVFIQSSKSVTGITLRGVTFADGGSGRVFDSSYNLAGATVTAPDVVTDLFTKDSIGTMAAGNSMFVIDGGGQTLQAFDAKKYKVDFTDAIDSTVLTFSGTHEDTLALNDTKQLVYTVGDKAVSDVTFDGSVTWSDSAYYTNDATKYKFNGATNVDAEKLVVNGTTSTALKADGTSSMTLLSATGMTAGTVTGQSDASKAASKVDVSYTDNKGVAFTAEAKGEVKAENGAVKYNINEVNLTEVDLSAWNGTASAVPDTWKAEDKSVAVNNANAITVTPTATQAILTAGSGMFADVSVKKEVAFDPVVQNGVTLSGTQTNVIKTSQTNVANDTIVYEIGKKDVKKIAIGSVAWGGDTLDGSSADYNYAGAAYDTDAFSVTFASPETVEAEQSMTLLKANETLTAIINEEKTKTYSIEPVSGVTVDAAVTGNLAKSGNDIVFTATENKATTLTFGKVEWTGDTALLDHSTTLKNVSFDGAKVDTSEIDFYKEMYIEADQQTTLVDGFDGEANITPESTKYMVGTAYEGESETKLENGKLILRTKTAAGLSEQTHKTVMAMAAGTALLAGGNEHIGKALESLGDAANRGVDGTSVGVSIGGSGNRYETGSHVNVNAWNATVAVGAKRDLKQGALEYGIFGEYGKGSYKLYNDDGGKGDGDAHYAGGGLMAKWTSKHDVYTEASFRLGRMSDSADNILEGGGNKYGYDVHANYYGAHVGIGKIFRYKGGKSLDVYGKYFYTKRDGVEYDAKQHYNLDSVASSVLRIGARYGTTDKKWNWYGGLAYEYEFDGEAKGTVNGTAIRAASIKGSSVRGEFGMRMNATKENPWQADISIYGYGGKHRGIGGNVSVAYTF